MKLQKKTIVRFAMASVAALSIQFAASAAEPAAKPDVAKETPAAEPAAPKAQTIEEAFSFLPEVVAEIGGQKITKQDFIAQLKEMIPSGTLPPGMPVDVLKAQTKQMVESMVDSRILLGLAEKAGIKPSPAIVKEEFDKMLKTVPAQQVEMMKKQLEMQGKTMDSYIAEMANDKKAQEGMAINKWIETTIASKMTVSDADIEKYYREHQEEYKTPESVSASHILIRPKSAEVKETDSAEVKAKAQDDADKAAKAKAEDILAKLKQGSDFGKLAEESSDCPSGKSAKGYLGEFAHDGSMVKEFEDAAFGLSKPGQLSDIVKTQFGYHIIKLKEKKPAGYVPLEQMKEYIKDMLSKKATMDEVKKILDVEKSAQKVSIKI